MLCSECDRLEKLRDFLSQQNAHLVADYIDALESHDPIFVDAVGALVTGSEQSCDVVATKLAAHHAVHEVASPNHGRSSFVLDWD